MQTEFEIVTEMGVIIFWGNFLSYDDFDLFKS